MNQTTTHSTNLSVDAILSAKSIQLFCRLPLCILSCILCPQSL